LGRPQLLRDVAHERPIRRLRRRWRRGFADFESVLGVETLARIGPRNLELFVQREVVAQQHEIALRDRGGNGGALEHLTVVGAPEEELEDRFLTAQRTSSTSMP